MAAAGKRGKHFYPVRVKDILFCSGVVFLLQTNPILFHIRPL